MVFRCQPRLLSGLSYFVLSYRLISVYAKSDFEKAGDDDDFFNWYAAKRGLDTLNKKLKIISIDV